MALAEGDTGTGTDSIEYSGVSSCLTVTCLLEDGTHVGGHLSLMKVNLDSTEVLPDMKSKIAGRKVTKVHLAGVLSSWHPAYLTKPLYSDTFESNYSGHADELVYENPTTKVKAPSGQLKGADMTSAVTSALGADGAAVTTEDKEGAFSISLT